MIDFTNEDARGNGQVTTGQESHGEHTDSSDNNKHEGNPPLASESMISAYKRVTDKAPSETTTIAEFCREVRNDSHRSIVEKVRTAIQSGDKDSASQLKRTLPAVSLSGCVTHGDRSKAFEEGRFRHSGWLQIDLDAPDLEGRDPEAVRDRLAMDKHIQTAFLSPSGVGVKALLRVDPCQTPEEHTKAFKAAEIHFRETHGLRLDPATKDAGRLCFHSFDPDIAWNQNAVIPLPIPEVAEVVGNLDTMVSKPSSESQARPLRSEFPVCPENGIHTWLMDAAWHCRLSGMSEPDTVAKLESYDGTLRRRLQPSEARDAASTVFSVLIQPSGLGITQHEVTQAKSATINLIDFPDSDAGNAERFHAMHGQNVRHVAESGQWLLWNGTRWIPDIDGATVRLFLQTMRTYAAQAVNIPTPQVAQSKAGFALRSTNLDKVNSGLALAKSIRGVTVSVSDLDGDPWLVGTPDGVIDLRTGFPITPERVHLLTKSIGASFDAWGDCPLWRKFIDTVTGGDAELASYLQAAVGYTLTGACREQCLFFLHGTGQNGKGVFSETIKALFGDYGQTAPETLFTRDRNSSATNDVARLAGCRLAIAAELDEGSAFAESRIKALTGGDTITARFLHKEFFDFRPSHKFWISGNHKPTVRGTDTGIWRRLRLIPFTVRIPDEAKDPALAEKLLDELPGILRWALAGCLEWQRQGLTIPECVRKATEDYRREEDVIGQFLDDCTVQESGARTPTTFVYSAYERWAEREGIQPKFRLSARRLIRRIEEHGFNRSKSNGVPLWLGLALEDQPQETNSGRKGSI